MRDKEYRGADLLTFFNALELFLSTLKSEGFLTDDSLLFEKVDDLSKRFSEDFDDSAPLIINEDGDIRCGCCGSSLHSDDYAYCPHCGVFLFQIIDHRPQTRKPKRKRGEAT